MKYFANVEDLENVPYFAKVGHWINNQNGTYTCDQCGYKHSKVNFCPMCGSCNDPKNVQITVDCEHCFNSIRTDDDKYICKYNGKENVGIIGECICCVSNSDIGKYVKLKAFIRNKLDLSRHWDSLYLKAFQECGEIIGEYISKEDEELRNSWDNED